MHKVYLFQPQYSIELKNTINYWIPYSAGCIWSYVQQFEEIKQNFTLEKLFFKREEPELVINQVVEPDICGFSCYVWNTEYNLAIAKEIKQKYPNAKIIIGGPQANKKMLNDYDFIDSIVMAEGEVSFLNILKNILKNEPIEKIYNKERLKDLKIPSPYLTGVFEKIINENPLAMWSVTLETNRGCPYACSFCDWGGTTYSKVYQFELEKIINEFKWVTKNNVGYIFFADANFGIFKERDLEITEKLSEVLVDSKVEGINIQFAKNSNDTVFKIAKLLNKRLRGLTVSVQSMNDQTLIDIKRKNMDINKISHMMDLSEKYDVPIYSDVIIGLPNETLDSFKNGLCELMNAGQHYRIEMWFAQLLINSELSQDFFRKKYNIKSIIAKEYISFSNTRDTKKFPEIIEIINSTNTMTTEDITDAFMYGWMIIHFHFTGYTQIISRYLKNAYNIEYKTFYDKLLTLIKKDEIFSNYYSNLKNVIFTYLKTGELLDFDNIKAKHLQYAGFQFLYDNKKHAIELGLKIAKELNHFNKDVEILQNNFIFDKEITYPRKILSKIDIQSWQEKNITYEISSKIDSIDNLNFQKLYFDNKLKNKFTMLS